MIDKEYGETLAEGRRLGFIPPVQPRTIPYTVEHDLAGQTRIPQSAEVVVREGRILARIVVDGIVFVNPGPSGAGFSSKLAALDFCNRTMREGATIR